MLEGVDLGPDLVAMAGHGRGVALGITVFTVRTGCLRHQRAQPGLSGFVGEVCQLLVGHPQVLAQAPEAGAHIPESALDELLGHDGQCMTRPRIPWHRRSGRRPAPAVVIGALVVLVSCGGGESGTGCDTAFQEQLDPASGVHIIDGSDVIYLTDPPTSGPHGVVAIPDGAQADPLARTTQVAILEAGKALVQYDQAALSSGEVEMLEAIDDPRIVTAPNPSLDEPIVVTAWTWKMVCAGGDAEAVAAIGSFAEQRAIDAPGSDL